MKILPENTVVAFGWQEWSNIEFARYKAVPTFSSSPLLSALRAKEFTWLIIGFYSTFMLEHF